MNSHAPCLIAHFQSPLGNLTAASNGNALTGLWFDDQRYFGATRTEPFVEQQRLPVFDETAYWLSLYFSGTVPDFLPPISLPQASDFRRRVWELLRQIPYGQTVTYGSLASKLFTAANAAHTGGAQAVGGAVGHNPILLLIPCHRVVGANGVLTGYAAGIARKRALLALEQGNQNWRACFA